MHENAALTPPKKGQEDHPKICHGLTPGPSHPDIEDDLGGRTQEDYPEFPDLSPDTIVLYSSLATEAESSWAAELAD